MKEAANRGGFNQKVTEKGAGSCRSLVPGKTITIRFKNEEHHPSTPDSDFGYSLQLQHVYRAYLVATGENEFSVSGTSGCIEYLNRGTTQ